MSKTQQMKLSALKENPENPRYIKDEKFEKLVQSIKDFPAMLEARPLVVDENKIVLGGNMRLKACEAAGLKQVPVFVLEEKNPAVQKTLAERGITFDSLKSEFIVKDNASFGAWDWDALANSDSWNNDLLESWGIDIFSDAFNENTGLDYDLLDDEELDLEVLAKEGQVMKSVKIECTPEIYPEFYELCKFMRANDVELAPLMVEKLRDEKKLITK